MKIFIRIIFILFSFCGIAQNIPAQEKDKLAYDFSNMLQPSELADIQKKLMTFRDSTEHKLVVVIVNDMQGYDIEAFANKLFNTWKIGKKDFNNGILLLVAKQEHKVRIETGFGLEAALPDIACNHIIEEQIVPAFKNGSPYLGIRDGVDAIIAKVTKSPDAPVVPKEKEEEKKSGFDYNTTIWGDAVITWILIPFIIFIGILVAGVKWLKDSESVSLVKGIGFLVMGCVAVPLLIDLVALSAYSSQGKDFDFSFQIMVQILSRVSAPLLGGLLSAIPAAIILLIIKVIFFNKKNKLNSGSTFSSSSSSTYSDYSDSSSSSSYSDYSDSYSDYSDSYSDYSDSGGSSGGGGSSGSW